jgi:hypothetical protein
MNMLAISNLNSGFYPLRCAQPEDGSRRGGIPLCSRDNRNGENNEMRGENKIA